MFPQTCSEFWIHNPITLSVHKVCELALELLPDKLHDTLQRPIAYFSLSLDPVAKPHTPSFRAIPAVAKHETSAKSVLIKPNGSSCFCAKKHTLLVLHKKQWSLVGA